MVGRWKGVTECLHIKTRQSIRQHIVHTRHMSHTIVEVMSSIEMDQCAFQLLYVWVVALVASEGLHDWIAVTEECDLLACPVVSPCSSSIEQSCELEIGHRDASGAGSE